MPSCFAGPLDRLTPEMRNAVARAAGGIENSIRQCLLHGEPELQLNVLNLISCAKDYSQIPALLNMIEDKSNPHRDRVIAVIQELVDYLYEHLNRSPDNSAAPGTLRDASRVRDQVISNLDQSCNRFEVHGCGVVLESLLVLGGRRGVCRQENSCGN